MSRTWKSVVPLTMPSWLGQLLERILLTHDQRTVPLYTYRRIERGDGVAGVIIIPDALSVRQVIEELSLIVEATSTEEWADQILRLPL